MTAVVWRRKKERALLRMACATLSEAKGFAKFAHDQGHYILRIEDKEEPFTRKQLLEEVFVDGKPLLMLNEHYVQAYAAELDEDEYGSD